MYPMYPKSQGLVLGGGGASLGGESCDLGYIAYIDTFVIY